MATPVNTVAAGGVPVVDVTATFPKMGAPVSEALPGKGAAVTKVAAGGLPVCFVTIGAGGASTFATFDGAATGATLSNGNLTATHANVLSGQGVRSTLNKTSGKYYFEVKIGATTDGNGDNAGIILSTGTYTDMTSGNNCCVAFVTYAFGAIYSNNAASSGGLGGACVAGDTIRICIDLDSRKAWFSRNNTNIWNNRAAVDDPVTGVSIVTIAAGSFAPALQFGAGAGSNVNNMTANFGQSAFSYAVPSGFGNWS